MLVDGDVVIRGYVGDGSVSGELGGLVSVIISLF